MTHLLVGKLVAGINYRLENGKQPLKWGNVVRHAAIVDVQNCIVETMRPAQRRQLLHTRQSSVFSPYIDTMLNTYRKTLVLTTGIPGRQVPESPNRSGLFCSQEVMHALPDKFSTMSYELRQTWSLLRRFNGHFPGKPGLAGVY